MVPAEGLLPNGQGIIQQVGCLLVFVLIPDGQSRAESDRRTRTRRDTMLDTKGKKRKLCPQFFHQRPIVFQVDVVKIAFAQVPTVGVTVC